MSADPDDSQAQRAADAFIAELRHWRAVTGLSQKALAKAVGYTPSYVSKVERGALVPSRSFAEESDKALRAGQSIVRRWKELVRSNAESAELSHGHHPPTSDDPQATPTAALVVEHERAELALLDDKFKTRIRRLILNVGSDPVTQYLARIAVDRFPGDPERSNQLYRANPLTWEEIGLAAKCHDEPMTWRVKHDRDAFKEVWLLFENSDGRFPLYPGESVWIEYSYTVEVDKWGPWWQRAVRLPTHRLSLELDFPSELQPSVWGMETSMTAEASPFRTQIVREDRKGRAVFTWSTDEPPLHARYRIEWRFKATKMEGSELETLSPSDRMASLGIVQSGDSVLTTVARPYDLPVEAEEARRAVAQITATMERVAQAHTFAKGMGLAAPQIGIGRAIAAVRAPEGDIVTLANPRVIGESRDVDEQYEGCLSFFDVRGMVPRPLAIEVEHEDVDGRKHITAFEAGMARLVAHEIDHLYGVLYTERMRPGVDPISVAQYKGTGRRWSY